MARKQYILGNWKMNKTCRDAEAYTEVFCPLLEKENFPCAVGIAPPFTALSCCTQQVEKQHSSLMLGAQNVYWEAQGAFTGEISLEMLKEFQTSFVLIGHSERRYIFNESEALVAAKMRATASSGIVPVLCIGENLDSRENGETQRALEKQLVLGLMKFPHDAELIIAYEPIWAIGTGKVAEADDVQNVHAFCRQALTKIFSQGKAQDIPILYGGSVKANNTASLASCEDVDGVLVGGASLDSQEFFNVVKNFCDTKAS